MTESQKRQIQIYGGNWCGDCLRAKRFLDARHIPYEWYDVEEDSGARDYVLMVNNGSHSIPTILFPDGSILVEPSNVQLAKKLGI